MCQDLGSPNADGIALMNGDAARLAILTAGEVREVQDLLVSARNTEGTSTCTTAAVTSLRQDPGLTRQRVKRAILVLR